MTTSLGGMTFQQFAARSHNWDEGMNNNALKASMMLYPSVKSRTTALPATPSDLDYYIDPATKLLSMWFDGEWKTVTPKTGIVVYVEDAEEYVFYTAANVWQTLIDLNATHDPVERTLAFYNPGLIRPNAVLFHYVAGMEFTIPQDAPGSGAVLDVAPTGGSLVFTMYGPSGQMGTITFADGETEGTISFPSQVIVQATLAENQYTPAQQITIRSPSDTLTAEGLAVTIRGEIRAID